MFSRTSLLLTTPMRITNVLFAATLRKSCRTTTMLGAIVIGQNVPISVPTFPTAGIREATTS